MFDARSFMRKRALSITQPFVAHGFKGKLVGNFADTPAEIHALAIRQPEKIKMTEAVDKSTFPEHGLIRKPGNATLTAQALGEFLSTKADGTVVNWGDPEHDAGTSAAVDAIHDRVVGDSLEKLVGTNGQS